ncbi:hypothetical protein RFN58_20035 [Streptomyces iakyrus]|uniref:hypothetical protein n=1 Tax=Streptomyces iakyrus TaxID=68219 RepID=UPI0005246FC5|nr:hypothetical protein [Streptomyces iakyrus]
MAPGPGDGHPRLGRWLAGRARATPGSAGGSRVARRLLPARTSEARRAGNLHVLERLSDKR